MLRVFVHTNRPVNTSEFWAAAPGVPVNVDWSKLRDRKSWIAKYSPYIRYPAVVEESRKYEWVVRRLRAENAADGDVALLVDDDVSFACDSKTVLQRFYAAATPMLVGGEYNWSPRQVHADTRRVLHTDARDHFGASDSEPHYPNGGTLIGTVRGWRMLVDAIRMTSAASYPCCIAFVHPRAVYDLTRRRQSPRHAPCTLHSQACLQTVFNASVYTVDVRSRIFANMYGRPATDAAPDACVRHFNGRSGRIRRTR